MFTAFGCVCAVLVLMVVCVVLGFYWIYLRIRLAWCRHLQNEEIKQRQAQCEALVKEEHECWVKLTEPDHTLTDEEREYLELQCIEIREQARKVSYGKLPNFPYLPAEWDYLEEKYAQ